LSGLLPIKERDLTTINIAERLRKTLAEFVEDWGLDVEITAETSLVEDLEFDSIDVIQFVVAMENAFESRSIGFQNLLMQDGRYVDDLSVGQIEAFIASRL
jgi:acyl carrier protein